MSLFTFVHLMFHLLLLVSLLPAGTEPVEVAIRKCLPGLECTIHLSSDSYTADLPHMMVVREDHPCGSPPDSQFQAENPTRGTAPLENTSVFNFGMAGPSPGLYRLCLCTLTCVVSDVINPLAFTEDVGDLLVPGPLDAKQMPAMCIAGGPSCVVNVTAIGIHAGDVLSAMPSGSECSSDPFGIVSRKSVPEAEAAEVPLPYGVGIGSIEFRLDEKAISPSDLLSALLEAFISYFEMDVRNMNGTSGIFFSELLLDGQSVPLNATAASGQSVGSDAWEVFYELLDAFDKVRSMKSLVESWSFPMGSSNTSFQYFLRTSVALLATNTSMIDDLIISNVSRMAIQPLTAQQAQDIYLARQAGQAAESFGWHEMFQEGSWRRLSGEESDEVLRRKNSSDDSDDSAVDQPNLTDDSDRNRSDISDPRNASLTEISLRLRSPSIKYYDLIKNPELTANLVASVQQRFAGLTGTTSDNVQVVLGPGSLLIFVTILIPEHAAVETRGQLVDKVDDGTIPHILAIDLSLVSGISSVSIGPITINMEMIDGQSFDSVENATLTSLTLAKRAHLLTSDLAFELKELNLFGGTWLLCYTYGGSSSSSMKVGDLAILGAGLLKGNFGVGHPFDLEVYAPLGGLLLEDRLMIVEAGGQCGAALATEYLEGMLDVPDVGSTGDANTSLQWENLVIKQAGIYTGCWCWSGQGGCNGTQLFSLQLNNFTVHGPLSFQPVRVAAGDSFELLLAGIELSSLDTIHFANGSDCGVAVDVRGDLDRAQGSGSARAWSNLTMMEYGSYQVCWCREPDSSSTNCSDGETDYFSVGVLEVWGPRISEHRCIMSSTCVIVLQGVPSQEPSSILLREGRTNCENSSAAVNVHGLTNPQRSQAATAGLYSQIRFSPVRARSGRTVQLAELVFYFNGSQVDTHGASAERLPNGRGPISEGPEFAVDKRRSTKFLDFDGVGFHLLLQVPVRIDAVSYITANDEPERDLTSFLLEGFTDKWHVLAAPERLSPPLERFAETQRIPCVVEVPDE